MWFLPALLVQGQADTVISRYRGYLLQDIQPQYELIRTWCTSLDTAGRWADISYSDQERANWKVSKHLERVRDLAIAWANPQSSFYQQKELWKVIDVALNHWLQMRYQNPNWWHNQIGVPQYMRDIVSVLRDTLSSDQLKKSLAIMGQLRVLPNGHGANLVWSAHLGLHYGAQTNDEQMMLRCRNLLLNEIQLTTKDGIQPDFSFHQHDQRLQMYQYGTAFLWDNIYIAWLLRGTQWAYPEEKLDLLKNMVLNGWQWMARGIHTVPGTVDRSVSRINALQSADIRKLVPYLCDLWPEDAPEFRRLEAIQNGKASLQGYRYYPYSDFSAFHNQDFSFFVKTVSTRTLPTESINSENLKGRLLHSGDAYLIRDGEEYFNLMPLWDWERLPGLTSFKGAYKVNRKPFVGSVSNGSSGLSVMDYCLEDKEQKQRVKARKFWASHGNKVVCLMAGLEALNTDAEVYTSLDQSRWRGEVTINRPYNVLKEGEHQLERVKWIHHSGFAYIPIQPEQIDMHLKTVSGTWKSINNSLSDSILTDKVFMPVIRHGREVRGVSTGYVLTSCATPAQAQALARKPNWTVLRNDKDCQAVSFSDGTVMAAFYQAGSLNLKGNRKLTVDKPCLIMIAENKLYASCPLHQEVDLILQLNKTSRLLHLPDHGFTTKGIILK
jgi:chondroitin AC lyase